MQFNVVSPVALGGVGLMILIGHFLLSDAKSQEQSFKKIVSTFAVVVLTTAAAGFFLWLFHGTLSMPIPG